jgi:hypothetical protein
MPDGLRRQGSWMPTVLEGEDVRVFRGFRGLGCGKQTQPLSVQLLIAFFGNIRCQISKRQGVAHS